MQIYLFIKIYNIVLVKLIKLLLFEKSLELQYINKLINFC